VVTAGNPEHSEEIEKNTDNPVKPGGTSENGSQRQQMNKQKTYFSFKNWFASILKNFKRNENSFNLPLNIFLGPPLARLPPGSKDMYGH